MIDFASLFWFAAYGAAFLLIALVLRRIARWGGGGTSLADAFGGGYRELPWPRGVQEEEPVRWNLAALGRRNPDVSRTEPEPDRPLPAAQRFGPRQACPPSA